MLKIVILLISTILFLSCEQKEIVETVSKNESQQINQNVIKPIGELKMLEIQSIPQEKLIEKRSLRYERINTGETVQVYVYYNESGDLVKLVEDYSVGNNENTGLRVYYFEDNRVPVAIVDSYEDWTDTALVVFSEKRSFYENGKAQYTDFRTAEYYELINDKKFEKVKTTTFDVERIFTIIDRKGSFSTSFLGVIETPSFPYILVGEPNKEDGFQSTLRVSKRSEFIDNLLLNQDKYLNKNLQLEFREIEEGNFVFTEFLSGKWKD